MGSEMQPQIMRAQKSEQILIFEKDMFSNIKALFSIIWVFLCSEEVQLRIRNTFFFSFKKADVTGALNSKTENFLLLNLTSIKCN
jgi:hypothetical protein